MRYDYGNQRDRSEGHPDENESARNYVCFKARAVQLRHRSFHFIHFAESREEMREPAVNKANVEEILGSELTRVEKKKELSHFPHF